MKKIKLFSMLSVLPFVLCSCSNTDLQNTTSGIFVPDEITYIAKEGKTISDSAKKAYEDYMKIHGDNIIVLNSDYTARIYGYFVSASSNSQVNGPITWSIVEGEGDTKDFHYLCCHYQGNDHYVLRQKGKGELYNDFHYISSETKDIDYAHITFKYVKSYRGIEAH